MPIDFIFILYWFITSIIAVGMTTDNTLSWKETILWVVLSFIVGPIVTPMAIGKVIQRLTENK